MTAKIYQNIRKGKDGSKPEDIYYTFKADQATTLTVVDGRFSVKTDKDGKAFGILSVSLQSEGEGDIEISHFKDGKAQPIIPYEWPLTVHIKVSPEGTDQEKTVYKLFTDSSVVIGDEKGIDLAKGFCGEIAYAATPTTKRILNQSPKAHDWETFADIKPKQSSIADADIPSGSGNSYGGGAKGQTEAERLSDRVQFVVKSLTADTPENTVLENIAKMLESDTVSVLHMLLS